MASKLTGRALGGKARAESLTAEERQKIARNAANTRWQHMQPEPEQEVLEPTSSMPIARWRGALNIIGVDVPCYVLNNGQKIIGRTLRRPRFLRGLEAVVRSEKYIGVKGSRIIY